MPTSPRNRVLLAALATTALLLSACGGDDQRRGADITTPSTATTTRVKTTKVDATRHDATTTSTAAAKNRLTILAKDIKFVPLQLTIPVNESVEILLDNRDAGQFHNIHFFTPEEEKTEVKPGKSSGVKDVVKLKIAQTGTYKFTCDVHPTPDMTGELFVK